jgi:ABC-type transport system involved in multi-copper enzyme maturation permease subunit
VLLATVAMLLAKPGSRGRLVRSACAALIGAGAIALVVGVATAAIMGFRLEARPTVTAVTVAIFALAYASSPARSLTVNEAAMCR